MQCTSLTRVRTISGTFRPGLLLDASLETGYTTGGSTDACGNGNVLRAKAASWPCFMLPNSANATQAALAFGVLSAATMEGTEPMYLTMAEGLTLVVRLRINGAPTQARPAPLLQLWTARGGASVLTLTWLSSSHQLRLSWRDSNGEEQLSLHSGALQLTSFVTVAFRLGTQPPHYQVYVDGEVQIDSRDEARASRLALAVRHVLCCLTPRAVQCPVSLSLQRNWASCHTFAPAALAVMF